MELSNKLSNLRKDIDSVENEIKDNVISNQNELFKYSESYSNINNYNISGTSQQLYDKISQLKSKISADYDELSNDIVDLTNVESALNLLRQVFKFRTRRTRQNAAKPRFKQGSRRFLNNVFDNLAM
ncbi:hypothetical protein E3P86_02945 [Wallemia ichthyophaga]|uniref:Conserved oligomeric Golgi complex subunit 5 N-terminal domain-containing protein n=1 Tax=Wallemia ichthyophaga TaxID=245174 RepID=A0A4T0IVG2_WALIC|nr:hypothetical protein E3P86_02945 [Wallemia ichthyophaga]